MLIWYLIQNEVEFEVLMSCDVYEVGIVERVEDLKCDFFLLQVRNIVILNFLSSLYPTKFVFQKFQNYYFISKFELE